MNDTPSPSAVKHLALMALCGSLMVPAHANPLQREPNERARREADNPIRVIIEAAAAKRGARPVEAAASPVPAKRTGPEPGKTSIRPAPITVIAAPSTAAAPIPDSPQGELPLKAPPAALPAETAPSSQDGKADITAPARQAEPVAQAQQHERPPPAVRLIYKVDPVVPERLQSQILRDTEVRVRLGIGPDGLVYRVEVPPDAPKGLEAPIQSAVRRWRFEPVSEPVTVTVVLVFRPEE